MKSAFLLVVLAFSSAAWGQQPQQPANDGTEVFTCSFSYSSGPASTFTRYCLSTNGNIGQFESPAGFEFVQVGNNFEGYGICDLNSGIGYYDYAVSDTGNWGVTSVSAPNATTRVFVRSTSDGVWQLTQTIKQIKASAASPGSAKVTMALKNLTGVTRTVNLLRFADVDANGTPGGSDHLDFTLNFTFARAPGWSYGLGLTNNTFTLNQKAFTQNTLSGPNPCFPEASINTGPFTGDGSIGIYYNFSVPAGATKTVNMTYKPI